MPLMVSSQEEGNFDTVTQIRAQALPLLSFTSTWHTLESFGQRDSQLRKYPHKTFL